MLSTAETSLIQIAAERFGLFANKSDLIYIHPPPLPRRLSGFNSNRNYETAKAQDCGVHHEQDRHLQSLIHEIRQRGIAVKIIVLSAHLTPEIREAYEQMNVGLLLEKPFDIHQLRSDLDKLAA